MSHWWKAYSRFSSVESKGIIALVLLIAILLLIFVSMPYWLPQSDFTTDPQLAAAFEQYKQEHLLEEDQAEYTEETPIEGTLFTFDPNTLDSAGFVRLGLRSKTVHMLLNWRRKGKKFYRKEDLKPLYTLKEEQYNLLAPYISIAAREESRFGAFEKSQSLPDEVDLNTADSATLVRLKGIGPTLAHKIINRRAALGGFLSHEQLLEVYRFADTTFDMLKTRLTINPQSVKKLRLNTASFEQLREHPYIGEEMARNIIMLREGLKRYGNIEQLRQVPLMNAEKYRKIAPYFVLE
jgi:DNA uptake protein ComE-like DNA-binding protein